MENCRVNVGFLVAKILSLRQEGWQTIKELILLISKSFGIAEEAAHVAVTTFHNYSRLVIKFSDHKNFSSFEKDVYAMNNDLSSEGPNALVGLEVSFKEMFDEQNGMRQDVPNALFYMTGKKCSQEEDQICPKSEFRQWRKKFLKRNISLFGIGVGNDMSYQNEMELLVGNNFYRQRNISHLLTAEFRRNLAHCDGKF